MSGRQASSACRQSVPEQGMANLAATSATTLAVLPTIPTTSAPAPRMRQRGLSRKSGSSNQDFQLAIHRFARQVGVSIHSAVPGTLASLFLEAPALSTAGARPAHARPSGSRQALQGTEAECRPIPGRADAQQRESCTIVAPGLATSASPRPRTVVAQRLLSGRREDVERQPPCLARGVAAHHRP